MYLFIYLFNQSEVNGNSIRVNPANICWSSRRLERHVLKTCWTRLQRNNFPSSKTSWRRLAKTSWRHLARRLEDVWEDEKLLRWRRLEDMSWRRPEDMSRKHLQDVLETKKWEYLYLTNLNVCVSYKSLFHNSMSDKSKANPKSLIRTQ